MPLSSSRIVQSHIKPRAARQSERTGTAQHHRPNATRAVLATTKPSARSLLTRLLTKRAGAKTSYNLLTYSSMECAAWARISNRRTSWPLCSTRTLESYYRLCCWQATLPKATSFSRRLSTKYANVGYDCRAGGLLEISILAVVSEELMTLRACENQLLAQVAGRSQDLQRAFWQIGPTLSLALIGNVSAEKCRMGQNAGPRHFR